MSYALSTSTVSQMISSADNWQGTKNKKYAGVASRIAAQLLTVSIDTCGGMASDAVRLVEAIADEGRRFSLGTWRVGRSSASCLVRLRQRLGHTLNPISHEAMLTDYTRMATMRCPGGKRYHSTGEAGVRECAEGE